MEPGGRLVRQVVVQVPEPAAAVGLEVVGPPLASWVAVVQDADVASVHCVRGMVQREWPKSFA